MSLNSELFVDPADRAAMKTLKAIPGFSQFVKAYMSIWDERQYRIINMSSNLRINDNQLKKYADMLPPICERLGIEVPDLYLELDVNPNAYTAGDKNPFIVMTSGLLETVPEELIPTVLAHECGHIACHHVLFTTMGRMVLSGLFSLASMNSFITIPLQMAFAAWMRCSELSADRAAVIWDGSPENMIKVCMCFAGYDKDIQEKGSVEAFIEQAEEYHEMVNDSKWDKTLEFIMTYRQSHPLNAVRAYKCKEWGNSEQFAKICSYLADGNNEDLYVRDIPVSMASEKMVGMDKEELQNLLLEEGFKNIQLVRTIEEIKGIKEEQVVSVSFGDDTEFEKDSWYNESTEVVLTYFKAETREEAIIAHEGKIPVPDASKKYVGRNYKEVVTELTDAGYTNILVEGQETRKSLFTPKNDSIVRVTIAGQGSFDKGEWFESDAIIRVSYVQLVQ